MCMQIQGNAIIKIKHEVGKRNVNRPISNQVKGGDWIRGWQSDGTEDN